MSRHGNLFQLDGLGFDAFALEDFGALGSRVLGLSALLSSF